MRPPPLYYTTILSLLSLPSFFGQYGAEAAIVTRTIENGDPLVTYDPPLVWNDQTCGETCWLQPDPGRASGGTWRESTYLPENWPLKIRIGFEGIAVSVFFIVADFTRPNLHTFTSCTFSLDGGPPTSYQSQPSSEELTSQRFLYNQRVFSRTGLNMGKHVLEVVVDGERGSWINFDYATYSFDDGEPGPGGPGITEVSTQPPTQTNPPDNGSGSEITPSSSTPLLTQGPPVSTQPGSSSGRQTASGTGDHKGSASVTSGASGPRESDSPEPGLGTGNDNDNTEDQTAPSSNKTAPIVGGVVGALVLCIGLAGVLWYLRRRKTKASEVPPTGTLQEVKPTGVTRGEGGGEIDVGLRAHPYPAFLTSVSPSDPPSEKAALVRSLDQDLDHNPRVLTSPNPPSASSTSSPPFSTSQPSSTSPPSSNSALRGQVMDEMQQRIMAMEAQIRRLEEERAVGSRRGEGVEEGDVRYTVVGVPPPRYTQ